MKTFMRVVLDEMPQDPDPIAPGEQATVAGYDGAGHLLVNWDNGRTLNLIPGVDRYHVVGLPTSQATVPSSSPSTDLGAVVDKVDKDGPRDVDKDGPRDGENTSTEELEKSFTRLYKLQHDLPEGNSSKCPRCGKPFDAHRGVFSRMAKVNICEQCGERNEGIEDWYIVKIWQGRFEEE